LGARWRRSSGAWRRLDRAEWRGREPKLVRHEEDGLMLSLLLGNMESPSVACDIAYTISKAGVTLSAKGSRRTPHNDVGEMLNHSEISSQSPRHETRRDETRPVKNHLRTIIEIGDSDGSVRQQLMKLGHLHSYAESDCESSSARQVSRGSCGAPMTDLSPFVPPV
jgi:hypothetical protein